jgi:hypothetical protein
MIKKLIILLFFSVFVVNIAFSQSIFVVSLMGNDTNIGTLEKPFATLEKARTEIRKVRLKAPNQPITVYLKGGVYFRSDSFVLDSIDAGSEQSPVLYKAYKNEKVVIHGGKKLNGKDFKLCNDIQILKRLRPEVRGKIWVIDLKKEGVSDYGVMKKHGFGTTIEPTVLELFINGKPQILGRYPNQGIEKIGKVYDMGSMPYFEKVPDRGAEFGYEYNRPNYWTDAKDFFLHGHFSRGFNDDYLPVERIDTIKKSIKLAQPHIYGVFSSIYVDKNKYPENAGLEMRGYYAYNLLEEIDQPNEWYLDRQTGKLYLYPGSSLDEANVEVSLMKQPLFKLTNTSNISIEGLDFRCTRGMGIYQEKTHHITINNCQFSNLGTVAVAMNPLKQYNSGNEIEEFHHNIISNCVIFNTGTGGVSIEGGNRKTLQSSENKVINCEFYNVDRVNETYSAAIAIRGVGATIKNCYFHDLKHWAVNFTGNNHLIEYNMFERVCTEADDMGVVYTGKDPSARGTIIQYNYFIDNEPKHKRSGMCGVYIDDGSGGITIRNNLFYKTGSLGRGWVYAAVYIHGGHDNLVTHNIFLDCQAGVGQAPWTDQRWKERINDNSQMMTRLTQEVDIRSEVYLKSYPELTSFLENPGRRFNKVYENVAINSPIAIQGDFLLRKNLSLIQQGLHPKDIDYQKLTKDLVGIKLVDLSKIGKLK